jgi:NADH dehydrogenase/NADH:ubiquinone oxidoreductase subunit G
MPVKILLNEAEVTAGDGEFVFDVARREGFEIPSLCHHEALPPAGACRICLVEADFGGKREITTSCNLAAADGMKVLTDSPEIRRHRAMNIELLLARAPGSQAIRALAAEYGVRRTRFSEPSGTVLQNCVLCELCVRVCEKLGHGALSAVGRGDQKRVGPPFGEPSPSCVGCASCVSVCPTSCIFIRDTAATRTIWGKKFQFHACRECGAPVITEEHRSHAISRCGLPEDYYDVCESCKQAAAARRFASVAW